MFYSLAILPANKQMPGDMFPRRSCLIFYALLDEKKKGITVSCLRNQLSWPLESYFSSWYYILSSIWRESSYNYDIWRRHKVARTYPCFLSKSVVSLVWCSLWTHPCHFIHSQFLFKTFYLCFCYRSFKSSRMVFSMRYIFICTSLFCPTRFFSTISQKVAWEHLQRKCIVIIIFLDIRFYTMETILTLYI